MSRRRDVLFEYCSMSGDSRSYQAHGHSMAHPREAQPALLLRENPKVHLILQVLLVSRSIANAGTASTLLVFQLDITTLVPLTPT
jgi:hypothetical protein